MSLKCVVAEHEIVRAESRRRQEVRALGEDVLAVAPLGRADAAERVGPPPRAAGAAVVDQERAVDEIGRLGPRADELERPLRDERLDEQLRGQHAAVGAGIEPLRQRARAEAAQVHRQVLIEAVVDLRAIVVVVVHLEPVLRGEGIGALDLVAPLLLPELVRAPSVADQRPPLRLVAQAARGEEPEPIAHDRAAERVLVGRHDVVDPGLGRRRQALGLERRQRPPLVVVERLAEAAREPVAARLRDDVDHAAAEPAELGRDAAVGDGGFLDRVFDRGVEGLSADVLVDADAVEEEQVLEADRAAERERARRSGGMNARRHQQDRVEVARRRQVRDQLLREVRRNLRGLRERIGRACRRRSPPR